MADADTYESPFSTRYSSTAMRKNFSRMNKYESERKVWVALATAQNKYGFVSDEELADIVAHSTREHIDIEAIRAVDRKIKHDTMAHIKIYTEQCKIGGKKIHYGGTSMMVTDNVDIMCMKDAYEIIKTRVLNILDRYKKIVKENAYKPCVAWTHIQPAGYTTVGYRFVNYMQSLMMGLDALEMASKHLKGPGARGIVGTSSSFKEILGDRATPADLEKEFLKHLGIEAWDVSTQVYPRLVDKIVLDALSDIATHATKFSMDIRIFTSPTFGDFCKMPDEGKVGSSAAPWKVYNPTNAERITSLSRLVRAFANVAAENACYDLIERTLDDSANRRIIIPESFLALDEICMQYDTILEKLDVRDEVIKRHLKAYGPFMNVEPLLMELTKRGANRQEMHGILTSYMKDAWRNLIVDDINPLPNKIKSNDKITKYMSADEINTVLDPTIDPTRYVGDAPEKTMKFLEEKINPLLEANKERLGLHVEPEF